MPDADGKYSEAELEKLHQALLDTKADHGAPAPSGREVRTTDHPPGIVTREPRQPAFPDLRTDETTQVAGAGSTLNVAFALSDASESNPDGSSIRKVKVFDGKLDREFPAGMGFGNYILDVSDNPDDFIIYAGATFNPKTLILTSRFLGTTTAGEYPEGRVESDTAGFLYWQIGFTFLSGDDGQTLNLVNTLLGNIHLELLYGSQNGKEALWAGAENGWLDLDFM